ncbi:MAG: hypothetical protein ACKOIA_06545 [Acidimicrobiia bacterium]
MSLRGRVARSTSSTWSACSTWSHRLLFPTAALAVASFIVVLAVQTAPLTPTAARTGTDRTMGTDDPEALPHDHGIGVSADGVHGEAHGDAHVHTDSVGGDAAHLHAVVAGTTPGTSDGHDHGSADSGHTDSGHTGGPAPTGPIVSVDDPRLSPAQQQAARTLRDRTRASIAALPNSAALTAAGYVSSGDSSYGMSHWSKDAFTNDGRELDPTRVESFMVHIASGRTIGAMYLLEPGKTMADVPDIAGELTTWHVHDPICFSNTARWHFVSFAKNGGCPAGSHVRLVPPMMHVWLEDQACGPFTGSEGHGATTCSSHSH